MLARSKVDWERFTASISDERLDFSSLHSPREIERAAENCTRALRKAIDHTVPKIDPAKPRRIRGWWCKETDEISQTVKQFQTEVHQDPTDQNKATAG